AGGAVAEHDVVAVIDQLGAAVAELKADGLDVLWQPGQEQPAGAGMKGIDVLLEALGGIVFRVDADRIKEDVAADAVAELLLGLAQPRRRQRADVLAAGVNEAQDHDLVLDQIVVELERPAVLGDERDVGHVLLAPASLRRGLAHPRVASATTPTRTP